ncbi:hypothetical protein ABZX39_33565 [Streptomyces collinus]|uniref:DUF6197 family protein n=1 Tax=Streptomyces collinus TaxID=42684 RepID=UPI0033BBFD5F
MSLIRNAQRPQAVTPPAAPARAPHPAPVAQPVQVPAGLLDPPPWTHRILPPAVRNAMETLGWWQNPVPQPPSIHLAQTLATLRHYGWCKSLDVSPTGRMCIRGAQTLLERHGHVTPDQRARAVHYLQLALTEHGIHLPFFAWNDLPTTPFTDVEKRLNRAAHLARSNGE